MTKKAKILVASLLVASLVGAGTATAFIIKNANQNTSGSVDDAIYLSWGETKSINDVMFDDGELEFVRCVSLNAPETNLNNTYGTFTISIAADEGKSIDGLTVGIFKDDAECKVENKVDQLDESKATKSIEIREASTYYLKFTMIDSEFQKYIAGEATFGGKATLSYDVIM